MFTAGTLRGVAIEDGVATIDLAAGFETTNNFGTTHLSGVVYSQIDATVFQFTEITGIEFEIEGERWCGFENSARAHPRPSALAVDAAHKPKLVHDEPATSPRKASASARWRVRRMGGRARTMSQR